MTMTRDQSCAERIETQFAGRFEDITAAINEPSEGEYEEEGEAVERLREDVLSFEVVRHVRILLSTGGPADGFDLVIDADGEVESGEYWFQDWFDGATRRLSTDELALIEQVYGPFEYLAER